jgi:catechol 2,3-dioxygenase-like lactoylglutathione lyase family enzyme
MQSSMKVKNSFSSFSVDNLDKAQKFYSEIAELETERSSMGLSLHLPGGGKVYVYPKQEHQPASFTVLNFVVSNLGEAMEQLKNRGVEFEYYEGLTDEDRILHGIAQNKGPDIAWFKDPSGNIISVLQET